MQLLCNEGRTADTLCESRDPASSSLVPSPSPCANRRERLNAYRVAPGFQSCVKGVIPFPSAIDLRDIDDASTPTTSSLPWLTDTNLTHSKRKPIRVSFALSSSSTRFPLLSN